MTIIAALHDAERGETWIGSDTHSHAFGVRRDCGPKWIAADGWAIGVAGDLRTINILRERRSQIFSGLSSPFEMTERLRSLLPEFGYDIKAADSEAPPTSGQDFLLAHASGIWTIGQCFAVNDVSPFFADGTGFRLSLGAMHALYNAGEEDPAKILRAALAAAIQYDTGCGGEAWLQKLEPAA